MGEKRFITPITREQANENLKKNPKVNPFRNLRRLHTKYIGEIPSETIHSTSPEIKLAKSSGNITGEIDYKVRAGWIMDTMAQLGYLARMNLVDERLQLVISHFRRYYSSFAFAQRDTTERDLNLITRVIERALAQDPNPPKRKSPRRK